MLGQVLTNFLINTYSMYTAQWGTYTVPEDQIDIDMCIFISLKSLAKHCLAIVMKYHFETIAESIKVDVVLMTFGVLLCLPNFLKF